MVRGRSQGATSDVDVPRCSRTPEGNIIQKNVMNGLEIWESGKGHPVK